MKWIRYIGGGLLVLVLLMLLWGVAIEPRLIDTEEEVVELPHLPPAWEGRRIAVIADFQIGMWWANTRTIERIVDRLIEERPAAVLIVGDFVYMPDERLDPIVAEATGLVHPLTAAGIPTF
ncbi:MAG: metallophosphoesterase, partial [Longimicrobiaceae bacterium]